MYAVPSPFIAHLVELCWLIWIINSLVKCSILVIPLYNFHKGYWEISFVLTLKLSTYRLKLHTKESEKSFFSECTKKPTPLRKLAQCYCKGNNLLLLLVPQNTTSENPLWCFSCSLVKRSCKVELLSWLTSESMKIINLLANAIEFLIITSLLWNSLYLIKIEIGTSEMSTPEHCSFCMVYPFSPQFSYSLVNYLFAFWVVLIIYPIKCAE